MPNFIFVISVLVRERSAKFVPAAKGADSWRLFRVDELELSSVWIFLSFFRDTL